MLVHGDSSKIILVLDAVKIRLRGDKADVILSNEEAERVLSLLADVLSYRVLKMKRRVEIKEIRAGDVLVQFAEGNSVKTSRVHFDILRAHLDVLKSLGSGVEINKREYAEKVIEVLAKSPNKSLASLAKSNLPFNWETFFGKRHDYYVLYYVPLLLLRKAGCVEVKRFAIEVLEIPTSVKQLLNYITVEV